MFSRSTSLLTLLTAVTLAVPARALDVDGVKIGLTSCTKAIALAYAKSRAACTEFRYADNVEKKDRWPSPPEFCVRQVDDAESRALARFRATREGAECVPPGFRLNPFLRAAFGWASPVADEAPSAAGECPYTPIFSELVYHPEDVLSVEIACAGDRAGLYAQTVDESYPTLLAKLRARHGKPVREWGADRRLPVFAAGGTSRQMNVLFAPKGGGQVLLVNLASTARRLPLQEEGPAPDAEELTYAPDSQVLYLHEDFLKVPRKNYAARAKRLAGPPVEALATSPRPESPYKALTPVRGGVSNR